MARILGLDLGSKTLGIAISDPMKIIAIGYEEYIFNENNYKMPIQRVKQIIDKEKDIEKIILGLPKNMDNTLSKRAQITQSFKDKLANQIDIPIIFVDERRTTVVAQAALTKGNVKNKKKKKIIDRQAAIVILQNFLDQG